MKKLLRSNLVLLLVLFSFITAKAHVWEIRVNQNTNGSLVWYVQSYHGLSECGFENSGIVINGTQYPLEQTFAGSCAGISPTIFAQNPSYVSNSANRASYAIIHTPFLGTTLNVQPYSTNVCWSSLVTGSGNFVPPPPPVCTSFPVNGWSNTVSLPGNNNGTACDPMDDTLPVTVTVNHQSCGSITGDGKFSLVLDPGGANITYGPFSYSTAISTNVTLTVPYGFNSSTQLSVIDNDFAGSEETHSLSGIPGTQYTGVPDSSPPVVLTQSFIAQLNGSGSAVINVTNIDAGSSDNCGIASLILSQTTFSCSNMGANTVTLTATDGNGNVNSATAVVTVVDNSAPTTGGTTTLAIPYGGQTSGWSPWYSYFSDPLPTGSTLTGIDLTYTAIDQGWGGTGAPSDMSVSGTYIGSGVLWHSSSTNIIHFTGSVPGYVYGGTNNLQMNFWGYPGWQAFWQGGTLTFHYQQAGGGECLSITKQLDASGHVTITSAEVNPGFTDACGIASLILSKYSFDCSNVGINNVVLTATDNNGNVSTCTALVTIQDQIAPVAIAQDITIQLDASGTASVTATQVNNGSSDVCGIASLALSQTAFDCSNVGVNTVTLTVTDVSGNVSTATASVTVEDHIAPVALAQDITIQLDASGSASITAAQINNSSTDACGIASLALSQTAFNCSNVGVHTVTLTVTDVNGNVSTATASVTVEDPIAPVALAQDITIQLDASGLASITAAQINNSSTDACGIASLALSQTVFNCSNVGVHTVTLTVTDVNGNVSTATASVTVEDPIAPVALAQDITIQLDASGSASITAAQINNSSTDACGIASLALSQTAFDCSNVGANTVTLTVTDVNGNVSTANAIVTVHDNIAPGLTVPANIVQLNDAGVCGAVVNIGLAAATDNCTVASVTNDALAFYPVGVTTVTWTAVDVNGNTTTGTQNVEITTNDPVIGGLTVSALTQLGSATLASATHGDNNLISGTWNWGDGSSTASVITGSQLSGSHIYSQTGLYDVSLTIVDACGKTDTEDYRYLVIYNPCNGFITGGGFITTSAGALASNPALSGKSNYGFNAKYLKGDIAPVGDFNFHINSADFKVKSTSLNWLMVNNDQAILKGMATVDGQAGFHFIASVIDGNITSKNGTDYLRLIVWDNTGNVVYDNQNGDLDPARASNAIENGQIVIHKSKAGDCYNYEADASAGNGNNASPQKDNVIVDLTPVQIVMTVYPNPVVESVVTISIENFGNTQARVDLTSLSGQLVYSLPSVSFIGGIAKIDFKVANLKTGNYLLRVSEIGTSKVGVKQITVSNKK